MDVCGIDALQHDAPWLEGCDTDRNHRRLAGRDIGEDDRPLRAPSINAVELIGRELHDRVETVHHRIAEDDLVHGPPEQGTANRVREFLEGDGCTIFVEIVDHIIFHIGKEQVRKFLDVFCAVLLVNGKEGIDNLADNSGAGTFPPATLVIADDRRRDAKAF